MKLWRQENQRAAARGQFKPNTRKTVRIDQATKMPPFPPELFQKLMNRFYGLNSVWVRGVDYVDTGAL